MEDYRPSHDQILFVMSGHGPPPSRDLHSLEVKLHFVTWKWWSTYQDMLIPGWLTQTFENFLKDKRCIHSEIYSCFGKTILEKVKDMCIQNLAGNPRWMHTDDYYDKEGLPPIGSTATDLTATPLPKRLLMLMPRADAGDDLTTAS